MEGAEKEETASGQIGAPAERSNTLHELETIRIILGAETRRYDVRQLICSNRDTIIPSGPRT